MILASRTDSAVQLAAIYSAADIFFNPTVEDNFPTVNLEAEACGTPVVTYDTGGCSETIEAPCSFCYGDYEAALARIAVQAYSRSHCSPCRNKAKAPSIS